MANKKGEFGIFIGEDSARGKGYGTVAAQLILRQCFQVMGLNRVYLAVLCDNISAIQSYEKVGFKVEGLLKQDYIRKNCKYDVVIMGITADMYIDMLPTI
jgi:RimJ/RimL family protein N-acetyltransferase